MYRQALGRASFILTGTAAGERELVQFYGVAQSNIRKLLHPVPEILSAENTDISELVPAEWRGNYWFYPAQFWAPIKIISPYFIVPSITPEKQ